MSEHRRIDRPEPGYWKIRLAKGVPHVATSIIRVPYVPEGDGEEARMERGPHFEAFIDGEPARPMDVWLRFGEPITKDEHDAMLRSAAKARRETPLSPQANPRQPIDINTTKPVF